MSYVLIDVRPRAAFLEGHIPGAAHLDPELDLSAIGPDPAVGGRHPLPDVEQLEEAFRCVGVGRLDYVLAIDDGSGWAARCWWLLRHLGHHWAGTFDLRSYVGPLMKAPFAPVRGDFVAQPLDDDTITAEEILARLDDPSLVLLDARSEPRWLGDEEPLDPIAGRIPGARHAFFEDPLPPGVTDAPELVTYCGSGVTACVVAQKLILAGRDDVRLYPGSFSEWCRRESYPIEKGPP